jgi:hypothetical protein
MSDVLPVSFRRRISCSLEALSIAWLISGVVFAIFIKGPNTISAWLIWGTLFFVFGWVLVGIQIVAFGDRSLKVNQLLLMLVVGAGGAVVMLLPILVTKVLATKGGYRWSWSPGDFLWPGVAFSIAGPTGWLYRRFLSKERNAAPPQSRTGT